MSTESDATTNNDTPPTWEAAVAGAEAALDRLRATLDEMQKVSDVMAKLIITQMDPTAIGQKPDVATATLQPN